MLLVWFDDFCVDIVFIVVLFVFWYWCGCCVGFGCFVCGGWDWDFMRLGRIG